MTELVRRHQLERGAEQLRVDAIERGLRFRIGAHREDELAAAVDEAERERRCVGRVLRLDDDIERQLALLGEADDRPDAFDPARLERRQLGGCA